LMIFRPGLFPGLQKSCALIAVAEKGYATTELKVTAAAGHSSFPPPQTAIGILSEAITKLEKNPHPPSLRDVGPMLDVLGRELGPLHKLLFANLWLFKHAIYYVFSQKPTLNCLIRTTTAVTLINGGIKTNVLPLTANASVNHRISSHQTPEDVLEYDRKIVNDPRVSVALEANAHPPFPASPTSDTNSYGYKLMTHTVLQLFPDVVVAPAIMIGNTDTRHFWDLSDNIFRFTPNYVKQEETARFHGRDERIGIVQYANIVDFYYHLIRNGDIPKFEN